MATKPKPTAATAKPNPTVSEELVEQGKQAVTRKKPGPDPLTYGCENASPGDNARYLRYALVSWDLPPIDIADPKQVEGRIKEYFAFCVQNDRKPNIVGMSNWLGVSKNVLCQWKNGELRRETHQGLIKKAYNLIEEQWVDYMQNGKINPASGIFLGKNMFGYKDTQDVVVTPKNPLGDSPDEKLLESRIADIPLDDVTTLE